MAAKWTGMDMERNSVAVTLRINWLIDWCVKAPRQTFGRGRNATRRSTAGSTPRRPRRPSSPRLRCRPRGLAACHRRTAPWSAWHQLCTASRPSAGREPASVHAFTYLLLRLFLSHLFYFIYCKRKAAGEGENWGRGSAVIGTAAPVLCVNIDFNV